MPEGKEGRRKSEKDQGAFKGLLGAIMNYSNALLYGSLIEVR